MSIDAGLRSDLESAIAAFADACSKGTTQCNNKVMTRIFKDCKLYTKSLTTTDTDITFSKFCTKGQKALTTDQFLKVIEHLSPKSGKSVEELCKHIASNSPKLHGATKASGDAATKRLTDTSKYTGAHKERFDESGKGKGIEGREYLHENDGYVGGYKEKGTYDEKH